MKRTDYIRLAALAVACWAGVTLAVLLIGG